MILITKSTTFIIAVACVVSIRPAPIMATGVIMTLISQMTFIISWAPILGTHGIITDGIAGISLVLDVLGTMLTTVEDTILTSVEDSTPSIAGPIMDTTILM